MPRVTQQKTRQALLVTGATLDPAILPEKIEIYDDEGNALNIPKGARREVIITTASLDEAEDTGKLDTRAPGEGESGTAEVGVGVMLTKLTVNRASRVRFYTSEAKRDADILRDRFTDPMDYPETNATIDHGCLAEFLLLTTLSLDNIPADYLVGEPGTGDIYYRIDNFDLVAGAVTVTLTVKDVEQ